MIRCLAALLVLVTIASTSARAEARAWVVTSAAFAWDETLLHGAKYVRERGTHITALIVEPLPANEPFEWAYEGGVYITLVLPAAL